MWPTFVSRAVRHIINLDKRNDTIASVCCVDTDPEEEVEQVEAQDIAPEMTEAELLDADIVEEEVDDEFDEEIAEESEE